MHGYKVYESSIQYFGRLVIFMRLQLSGRKKNDAALALAPTFLHWVYRKL
jgi:hypothetical protein